MGVTKSTMRSGPLGLRPQVVSLAVVRIPQQPPSVGDDSASLITSVSTPVQAKMLPAVLEGGSKPGQREEPKQGKGIWSCGKEGYEQFLLFNSNSKMSMAFALAGGSVSWSIIL